jgi:hypothetical protein
MSGAGERPPRAAMSLRNVPREPFDMARVKPSLLLATALLVGLAFWAGAQIDPSGSSMATAAGRLLTSLDDAQKAKASFPYDDAERLNWHFIPRARKGLPLKEMTPAQRSLAFGMLSSGLSRSGTIKATTIMSLEAILRDLEGGRGPNRDPELYYLSVFGTPSTRGRWGWRVEGHHLSLNFVIDEGRVVSATPAFFGSNPAEVRQGPQQGLRTLAEIEDRALLLLQALDSEQQKAAIVAEKPPADIPSNYGAQGQAGLPAKPPAVGAVGVDTARFNANQRRLLADLIQAYASDMPAEVATAWLADVDRSQKTTFAWYGPADRSQPHAYTIQGSTFAIEFNNTQNNANHIHSLWRSTVADFAL